MSHERLTPQKASKYAASEVLFYFLKSYHHIIIRRAWSTFGQHRTQNNKRDRSLLGIPLIFIEQIFKSFGRALVLCPEGVTIDVHGRAGLGVS